MIFDGKAFAKEIELEVKNKVRNLPAQAGLVKKPRIVSVMVGDDPASALYTRLKEKAAHRVGIDFEVIKIDSRIKIQELRERVVEIGNRADVTGVMVQLPLPAQAGLPGVSREDTKMILKAIPLAKDVDGLRWEESGVMPATVRAIFSIFEKIEKDSGIKIQELSIVVLGARGAVGKPLVHFLRQRGVRVEEVEWDTPENQAKSLLSHGEVIVSCVGKAGLVVSEMVREGVVAIDVGMSLPVQAGEVEGKVVGDMTSGVYQKASVAVPVPGGVGPVTVASLMANAVDLVL